MSCDEGALEILLFVAMESLRNPYYRRRFAAWQVLMVFATWLLCRV